MIPRLVMEVSKSGDICLLSHPPNFIDSNDRIKYAELRAHIKTILNSNVFLGFSVCCLCETEDMITKLDIYPHVFAERTFIYRPQSTVLVELCMLLSLVENLPDMSVDALLNILDRARFLSDRTLLEDAKFLARGVEALVSTAIFYYHPAETPSARLRLQQPLLRYKFYKTLYNEERETESGGLLKSIFFDSVKMNMNDTTPNCAHHELNILYLDSIFTKHFSNGDVIKHLKNICHKTVPRDFIL